MIQIDLQRIEYSPDCKMTDPEELKKITHLGNYSLFYDLKIIPNKYPQHEFIRKKAIVWSSC
jgi:hypothetical protein